MECPNITGIDHASPGNVYEMEVPEYFVCEGLVLKVSRNALLAKKIISGNL